MSPDGEVERDEWKNLKGDGDVEWTFDSPISSLQLHHTEQIKGPV